MDNQNVFYQGATRYGGLSAVAARRGASRKTFFNVKQITTSKPATRPVVQSFSITADITRNNVAEPQLTSQARAILNWIEKNSTHQIEPTKRQRRAPNFRHNPMPLRATRRHQQAPPESELPVKIIEPKPIRIIEPEPTPIQNRFRLPSLVAPVSAVPLSFCAPKKFSEPILMTKTLTTTPSRTSVGSVPQATGSISSGSTPAVSSPSQIPKSSKLESANKTTSAPTSKPSFAFDTSKVASGSTTTAPFYFKQADSKGNEQATVPVPVPATTTTTSNLASTTTSTTNSFTPSSQLTGSSNLPPATGSGLFGSTLAVSSSSQIPSLFKFDSANQAVTAATTKPSFTFGSSTTAFGSAPPTTTSASSFFKEAVSEENEQATVPVSTTTATTSILAPITATAISNLAQSTEMANSSLAQTTAMTTSNLATTTTTSTTPNLFTPSSQLTGFSPMPTATGASLFGSTPTVSAPSQVPSLFKFDSANQAATAATTKPSFAFDSSTTAFGSAPPVTTSAPFFFKQADSLKNEQATVLVSTASTTTSNLATTTAAATPNLFKPSSQLTGFSPMPTATGASSFGGTPAVSSSSQIASPFKFDSANQAATAATTKPSFTFGSPTTAFGSIPPVTTSAPFFFKQVDSKGNDQASAPTATTATSNLATTTTTTTPNLFTPSSQLTGSSPMPTSTGSSLFGSTPTVSAPSQVPSLFKFDSANQAATAATTKPSFTFGSPTTAFGSAPPVTTSAPFFFKQADSLANKQTSVPVPTVATTTSNLTTTTATTTSNLFASSPQLTGFGSMPTATGSSLFGSTPAVSSSSQIPSLFKFDSANQATPAASSKPSFAFGSSTTAFGSAPPATTTAPFFFKQADSLNNEQAAPVSTATAATPNLFAPSPQVMGFGQVPPMAPIGESLVPGQNPFNPFQPSGSSVRGRRILKPVRRLKR